MPVHLVVLSEAALMHVRAGAKRPPGQLAASELPPVAASWATTERLPVGAWKAERPVYRRHVAPCLTGCPVGNDVEGFLGMLARGDVEGAARALLAENPLPSVCGRVCFHPCEAACNRRHLDGAVSVRAVERFLGDTCIGDAEPWAEHRRATRKRVAVVGSGPAGLACSWALRLLGHEVSVLEQRPAPGGLLRYGIPSYRLPKDVLDREVGRLAALGIRFRCGESAPKDLAALRNEHDAVFVATGAWRGQRVGIAGDGACVNALEFLTAVAEGTPPIVGRQCAVIGGGNSAIDAARSARRLGAGARIVYRRTRGEMPAHAREVDDALAEGVELVELALPIAIVVESGVVQGVRCQRARLGDPDASGRPVPVPVPGSEFFVPASTVIDAIGETVDRETLTKFSLLRAALAQADSWTATPVAGVFAGGDLAGNPRTVADAIGSGKRAAMAIDRFLGGAGSGAAGLEAALDAFRIGGGPASLAAYLWGSRGDVRGNTLQADFEHLNPSYFQPVGRHEPLRALFARSPGDFEEVEQGFGLDTARRAAARCFSCGRCTLCGNCLVFCPEGAIQRDAIGGAFVVREAHCKGCGICVEECPRRAIHLEPVQVESARSETMR